MIRCCVVFLAFVFSVSAYADDSLMLEDCLREAAVHNPALSAARASVEKARYDRKAGYSDFLPQISADAEVARRGSENDTGTTDSSDQSSYGISASQSLFAGGAHRAQLDLRSARLTAAEADLASAEADTTYKVRQSFADLYFSRQQLVLAREIENRQRENVDLIELRYEGGRENQGAVLRTKATLRDAESTVAQALRNIEGARRELALTLGRPGSASLELAGELEAPAPPAEADIEELAAAVPSYARSRAAVDSAQASFRSARSQYWPDLSVNAGASRSGDAWPPGRDAWSVGLAFRYPFFPGGRNVMENLSADAEVLQAVDQFDADVAEIELLLTQTLHDYQSAVDQLAVARAYLDAARVRAEIAREQYASGLISFEDWDRIEGEWTSSQKSELSSRRAAVLAAAEWDRVRGISMLSR